MTTQTPAYPYAIFLLRLLFRLFARVTVEGKENIPTSGPVLVVSNHTNNLDPPVIAVSMPRQIIYMAKQEIMDAVHGWQHWCLRSYGMISMDRSRVDRGAMQEALDYFDKGGIVGIFPEGTRSHTGVLQRPGMGAALLVFSAQVPVVPVAVMGLAGLDVNLRTFLRRPRIHVRFGEPLTFTAPEQLMDRKALREASERMMRAIAALLPEELRGSYGEAEKGVSED